MTKYDLRDGYVEWKRGIAKRQELKEKAFIKLQELNVVYGDGNGWCDVENNLKGIYKNTPNKISEALQLIAIYYRCEGQREALSDLSSRTNDFFDLGGFKT